MTKPYAVNNNTSQKPVAIRAMTRDERLASKQREKANANEKEKR